MRPSTRLLLNRIQNDLMIAGSSPNIVARLSTLDRMSAARSSSFESHVCTAGRVSARCAHHLSILPLESGFCHNLLLMWV